MSHDIERFSRWAPTYDRHLMHRFVSEPVHKTVLELAAAQVPKPTAILDVGSGTGKLLRAAEERFPGATLEGVDAASGMVKQAQATILPGSRIRFQLGTAERLPFPDGQFDLVFSTMTFHHWADQSKGAGEVARVMKPSGRWVLADLVAAGVMRYIRRLLRMNRFPERMQLDALLRAAGLQVVAERRVQSRISVLAIGRSSSAM